MTDTRPVCACHGSPMYRDSTPSRPSGESWRCAVKKRNYARRRYRLSGARKRERQRERYDTDPVYRIEKNLRDRARRRRQTIEKQRAALASDLEG